jgi:hypothetical protein
MSISQSQLKHLSPEDRIAYKRWLRGGLLFYGMLTSLFIFSAFVNQSYTSRADKIAGNTQHAVETVARN